MVAPRRTNQQNEARAPQAASVPQKAMGAGKGGQPQAGGYMMPPMQVQDVTEMLAVCGINEEPPEVRDLIKKMQTGKAEQNFVPVMSLTLNSKAKGKGMPAVPKELVNFTAAKAAGKGQQAAMLSLMSLVMEAQQSGKGHPMIMGMAGQPATGAPVKPGEDEFVELLEPAIDRPGLLKMLKAGGVDESSELVENLLKKFDGKKATREDFTPIMAMILSGIAAAKDVSPPPQDFVLMCAGKAAGKGGRDLFSPGMRLQASVMDGSEKEVHPFLKAMVDAPCIKNAGMKCGACNPFLQFIKSEE